MPPWRWFFPASPRRLRQRQLPPPQRQPPPRKTRKAIIPTRTSSSSGQRVISLTLNRKVVSETLTAAEKVATDGDWHSERGEAIVTRVRGDTRINVTLRARAESDLLESERGIIQPTPRLPYAISGNV